MGAFFIIEGKWGQMCSWNLKKIILIGGIFYNWGQMGANVLVEFENAIFKGGIFLQLGAKNYFGIEKISFFGNYLDP